MLDDMDKVARLVAKAKDVAREYGRELSVRRLPGRNDASVLFRFSQTGTYFTSYGGNLVEDVRDTCKRLKLKEEMLRKKESERKVQGEALARTMTETRARFEQVFGMPFPSTLALGPLTLQTTLDSADRIYVSAATELTWEQFAHVLRLLGGDHAVARPQDH